jgi:ADP-ribose pyrophosphatase
VKRRAVHRGRSFALYVEEAELPGGRCVELDVVRHPGAAAVVPFSSPRDVLLIRQYRHAAGGTIWEVPAGKLDGDTPEVCAAKELEEEAGRRAASRIPAGRPVRAGRAAARLRMNPGCR